LMLTRAAGFVVMGFSTFDRWLARQGATHRQRLTLLHVNVFRQEPPR